MVIHVDVAAESATPSPTQQLADTKNGREIRLGKRLLGWNLNDTVVLRSQGLSQALIENYVRHFAAQRHVIFESDFQHSKLDPFIALARDVRDYLFAFVETQALQGNSTRAIKETVLRASCNVVTLRPDRSVQQLEVLLLASPLVLGSYEPLVLPQAASRTSSRKTEKAA